MIQNFKGWHVLGASFTTAMLMAGATFYSFQHFVTPIESEFSLSRDQVNLGMIAFLLSSIDLRFLIFKYVSSKNLIAIRDMKITVKFVEAINSCIVELV